MGSLDNNHDQEEPGKKKGDSGSRAYLASFVVLALSATHSIGPAYIK